MAKHNQTAALGTLSDFASSPSKPEDRLERIESRLENIEKLLNTVLYAVTDLNETVDKVSKSPAKSTQTQKPTQKKKQKRQQAPQAKKQQAKAPPAVGSHFTPEQEAEITANKADVQNLFTDRESLTKADAVELLPDVDPKVIGRVLSVLTRDGYLTMTKPEATDETPDPKVIFTRKQQTEV